MLGLGSSFLKAAASLKGYIKDNLKIYFDFASKRAKTLEFVGTGSCAFDGTNDYITYDDADTKDALRDMDELTIMGWCSRLGQGGTIINKGAYYIASTNWGMEFQNHVNNRWRFSIAQGIIFWCAPPGDIVTGGTGVGDGTGTDYTGVWHHYALTYNKNAAANNLACNMYIDGELQGETASGTLASISDDNQDITIATDSQGAKDLNGKIKNCGAWNRVLSQTEIQNIMYKSYADLKGSELTHLQFWADLDSDLNAKDNAGDSITGTASNDAIISTSIYGNNVPRKPRGFDNAPTAQADLIGSGSAYFDESEVDHIAIANGATICQNATAGTISAWIKTSTTGWNYIFSSASHTSADYQLAFSTQNNGYLAIVRDGSNFASGTVDNVVATTNVCDGVWHHVAVTSDGSNYKFYIDGVSDAISSGTDNGGWFDNVSDGDDERENALIGAQNTDGTPKSSWGDGNLCQIGIWTAALTQEEIQSIKEKSYSELTTAEKSTLISWWGLDSNPNTKGVLTVAMDSVNETTTEHINISGITNTIGVPDTGGTAFCYFSVATGGLTALASGGLPNWTISGTVNTWNNLVAGATYKCELTTASSFSTVNAGRVDLWDISVGSGNVLISTANATAGNTHTVYFYAPSALSSFKLAVYDASAITSIVISRHNGNVGAGL